MNIAFPAFLIFIIILPGFIFHSAFRVTENTNLDYSPFSSVTVRGVITSAFFHAVWVALSKATGYRICFDTLLALLIGEKGNALQIAISVATAEPRATFYYFASLYVCVYLLGHVLRFATLKFGWDRRPFLAPLIQYKTDWYYLFRPEIEDDYIVIVSAVVEQGREAYLYSGMLIKYYLGSEGQLDRLVLTMAARRMLSNDRKVSMPCADDDINSTYASIPQASEDNAENERFYEIDGDYFVLRYAEIKTLNVKLVLVEDDNRDEDEFSQQQGDSGDVLDLVR